VNRWIPAAWALFSVGCRVCDCGQACESDADCDAAGGLYCEKAPDATEDEEGICAERPDFTEGENA